MQYITGRRFFASWAVTLSLWTCVKCSQEGATAEVSSWPSPYYNNYDGPVDPAFDQRQDVAAIAPAVFQFFVAAAMVRFMILCKNTKIEKLKRARLFKMMNLKVFPDLLLFW